MKKNLNNSYKRGWRNLRNGDLHIVKTKIMAAININTRAAWYYRLNGYAAHTREEAKSIENIFLQYGVKDIWGE